MPAETRSAESPQESRSTLLLDRRQVSELLEMEECIDAVEAAFRAHAEGRSIPSGVLGAHVEGGGFHIKTAGLLGPVAYFAVKLNGNFHDNAGRHGLPRIQGVILLCDARNGYPLAVMDSTYITGLRTAAATGVAAKHLARAEASVATICGCGVQGRLQLEAICRVRPIRTVHAIDRDPEIAARFGAELGPRLGLDIRPTGDLGRAVRESHVCVTCTPSREPLLGPEDVSPGTFIAAIGADSEEKQELHPSLLAAAGVVVDHLEQCATIGDLHHALESGAMERSDIRGELHEVVAGARPGRVSDDEILVFDSTGVALQDVAAAVLVFEKARESGHGTAVELL